MEYDWIRQTWKSGNEMLMDGLNILEGEWNMNVIYTYGVGGAVRWGEGGVGKWREEWNINGLSNHGISMDCGRMWQIWMEYFNTSFPYMFEHCYKI